jgi:hypothetical protein
MRKVCIIAMLAIFLLAFFFIVQGCGSPPEGTTYSVIYHDNGSTSGYPPADSGKYTTGMNATVLGKGTLLKEDHTFKHWNTRTDDSGDSYNEGETVEIKQGNVFLYAIWIETTE